MKIIKKISLLWFLVSILFSLSHLNAEEQSFKTTFIDKNGDLIDMIIIPGSPPPDQLMPIAEIPDPKTNRNVIVLEDVPAFDWCYGCFPTSAAMIAGYYDRTGYANAYAGPTDNGFMPMDNTIWGQTWWPSGWVSECPLSATHMGIDGRTVRGHVDDYWIDTGSTGPDPYIVNGWAEHTLGKCVADYAGTSQWDNWGNSDGSTTLFFNNDGTPLYDYTACEPGQRDGCHGFKLFFESRNYNVMTNYNQYIYGHNGNTQGFTFDQFKNEIDNGYPVLIFVVGHVMMGFGYNDAANEIYIHDTWDHNDHIMTWGGMYNGMQHESVAVIHLDPINEKDILTAFYNCLNGDNWTTNSHWLSDLPLHYWYGLTISNGHVVEINLLENNLTGILPNEIGNFTYLEKLDLEKNNIGGAIPSTIGNLSELIQLDLSENQFNGHIPSTIGALSNLEKLYLHENQFSGPIPNEVGNLSSLTDIFLYDNQFESIPNTIGNLTNVEWIDMRNNHIMGHIPSQIGTCTSLVCLNLDENYITGSIPPEIGNLNNLCTLILSNNALSGPIPSSVGNLNSLTNLELIHNYFSGAIPSEIGNLSNLQLLFLENNQLTGSIPTEIGNCSSLIGIYLDDNDLTGSIPNSIGNLTNLHWLLLNNNQLTDSIPSEIGNATSIWWLHLSNNKLSGAVPTEINNLSGMTEFRIDNNEIFDLPDMSQILSGNTFTCKTQNNKLTFEDLESNAVYWWFEYTPQDSVLEKVDTLVSAGSDIVLESTVGGQHNLYQWFLNGSVITDATDSTLVIDSVAVEDQGIYTCNITNTVATELTLHRRPVNLTVEVSADPEPGFVAINKIINYPNPFKVSTNMMFNIQNCEILFLKIYNTKGKLIRVIEYPSSMGENTIIWDGSDQNGQKLPSGIYLYQLMNKDRAIFCNKCLLIK